MQYIAFDSHKHYTLASVEGSDDPRPVEFRLEHWRGAIRDFLKGCEPGSPVAVETVGNWYWLVDEIQEAGFVPHLVHARKAKLMMGMVCKTDKLDARGMNRLQRAGTLPIVWIPPGELRDQRDLPRTRMVLTRQRTQLKNRIHATLAKYALTISGTTDIYGPRSRETLLEAIRQLPEHTRFATERLLEELDGVIHQINAFEKRMSAVFRTTPEVELLMSLPGVGFILATVIDLEIGSVGRFPRAEKLAAYAGTTPRVHSSGGKTRYGRLRPDVNRYLKWAFIEAANCVCLQRRRHPDLHVSRLYNRLRGRKGHGKAIGAIARHLAEATYWILTKQEPYRPPQPMTTPSNPIFPRKQLVHGRVSAFTQ
jgi:transposase